MNKFALDIRNLTHSFYGRVVLEQLNLQVERPLNGEPAQCLCVMGSNGAGKSTLLSIIHGRIKAHPRTHLEILGSRFRNASIQKMARIGVVSSLESARDIEPELSVISNLYLIPRLSDIPWWRRVLFYNSMRRKRSKVREEALQIASDIGWEELKDRLPEPAGNLSYGWRKLLSYLRICIADAKLILLDEPFAGLDPAKVEILKKIIRGWCDDGRVIVFVEHIRSAAMRKIIEDTATRLVLLHNGRIVLDEHPSIALDHPTFHKAYVGNNNGLLQPGSGEKYSRPSSAPALEFNDLSVSYDDQCVLRLERLTVPKGGYTLLIGPNGSGKSTLLGSVHGLGEQVRGEIRLFEKLICSLAPHEVARSGVGIVPQKNKLFSDLSVARNIRIAASQLPSINRKEALQVVKQQFPVLIERASQIAGTLSSGEQAQLALALALIRAPKILLADELSIGLDATRTNLLHDLLQDWSRSGGTVVLAEQNYQHALLRCNEVVALQSGRLVWRSKPQLLTPEIQTALFAGQKLHQTLVLDIE